MSLFKYGWGYDVSNIKSFILIIREKNRQLTSAIKN